MSHGGAIMGSVLLVHGGFNTESKKTLEDFAMFDMELLKWIDCKVFLDNLRIDEKHFHYDHMHP